MSVLKNAADLHVPTSSAVHWIKVVLLQTVYQKIKSSGQVLASSFFLIPFTIWAHNKVKPWNHARQKMSNCSKCREPAELLQLLLLLTKNVMLRTRSLCQDLTPSTRFSFAWWEYAKLKHQENTEQEVEILCNDRCCCFGETFLVTWGFSCKRRKYLKLPLLQKSYF